MTGKLILDGGYDEVDYYYADGSIIYIDNGCNMDMYNGVTLQNNNRTNSSGSGGAIINQGILNIYGGKISNNYASYAGGIYNNGTVLMTGGEISHNVAQDNGSGGGYYGGVFNYYSTFTMNGGSISNNKATHSYGGVYNNGEFTLNNGKIDSNIANEYGGVYNNKTFAMNGGSISHNQAMFYYGGVYNSDEFTLNNGKIDSNIAGYFYGGVYNGNTFTMNGGSISHNQSTHSYGGVYNDYAFTMNGGSISHNYATQTGGVYNRSKFILNNGRIDSNIAHTSNFGGVENVGNFTMNDGSISHNYAEQYVGGVYNNYGEFTINNGRIENNVANLGYGGGIYNETYLTVKGGIIRNNSSNGNGYGNGIYSYYNNISLQGTPSISDDIALENCAVIMDSSITSNQTILLTPIIFDGTSTLLDYTPCRTMVSQGSNYTFKGEDLSLFALTGVVNDTVLAFSPDNSEILIYNAPATTTLDTVISTCGQYVHYTSPTDSIIYTGNGIAYDYISGGIYSCQELSRKITLTVYPLMEPITGSISGNTNINAAGTYTYSIGNTAGESYQWTCSNSSWTKTGSGASITLNIQSTGTATLTLNLSGKCDVAVRTINISANISTNPDGIAVGANNYSSLRVYPNPTKGQLIIENYELSMGDIEVYDVVGQKMLTCQISTDNSIDISHLAPGLYFLKTGNKMVKIVKE
jgi:hypothetical protein